MSERIVEWIPKNDDEQIRIALVCYRGAEYLDMRIFIKGSANGEMLPTRKGFVIPRSMGKEVIKGLRKAQRHNG